MWKFYLQLHEACYSINKHEHISNAYTIKKILLTINFKRTLDYKIALVTPAD